MSAKIYVGNLDRDTIEADLQDNFGKFGHVKEVVMKEGFAFVLMDDQKDADDAIRSLNNT